MRSSNMSKNPEPMQCNGRSWNQSSIITVVLTDGALAGFQDFIKMAFARNVAVRSLSPAMLNCSIYTVY
jgi:hypothetical protein